MPSSSNTADYDVEKILSKRIDSKGRTYYLIKWKGRFYYKYPNQFHINLIFFFQVILQKIILGNQQIM